MRVALTVDIGSTHEGSLSRLKQHIDVAATMSAPVAVKCQLFKREDSGPNIWLDPELYKAGYEYAKSKGITYYASCFDLGTLRYAASVDDTVVKLAYSKRLELCCEAGRLFKHVIMSGDYLDACLALAKPKFYRLLCLPVYPVWHPIRAEQIPWVNYDGWSSHCLGIDEDYRVLQAAKADDVQDFLVEKHVRHEGPPGCPDACFAVTWGSIYDLLQTPEIEWTRLSLS